MTTPKHTQKLAVVIATKDRPEGLEGLLASLMGQSYRPHQTIVVDGGDRPVNHVANRFADLDIDYIQVYPPSLTKQKNSGTALVRPDIALVGFLDDDFYFEDGSLEAMMTFWDSAPAKVGGASFNMTDYHYSRSFLKSFPKRVFGIDDRDIGRVLRSGFNTPIWDVPETKYVRWLCGGATIWRKEIFDRWHFDEWFNGSGLWEDVRFSYRASKEYELAVVGPAKGSFLNPPITRKKEFGLGKTQVINWLYFVRNNPELSVPMCLWACLGRTVANLSKGISGFHSGYLFRAAGNLLGLIIAAVSVANPLSAKPSLEEPTQEGAGQRH